MGYLGIGKRTRAGNSSFTLPSRSTHLLRTLMLSRSSRRERADASNPRSAHRSFLGALIRRRLFDWLTALLQPSLLLCLLMIAALWAALAFIVLIERQRTLNAAIEQGGNFARLFEEDTASMLRGVDRTLLLLRQTYEEEHFDLCRRLRRTFKKDELTF
jgi:hypothetical protein